jgi:acyl-CoA thioester hydrolase
MQIKPYHHTVQYYETDMMGITHHANYLHWMEEARVDLMDQMGFPYADMEARDVYCPVVSVQLDYKHSSTFNDDIIVNCAVASFRQVSMEVVYEMTNAATGQLVCKARSKHCFVNKAGQIIRMRREMPEFCEALAEVAAQDAAEVQE